MSESQWTKLTDDELLDRKISGLGLKTSDTEIEPLIQQLYEELSQKGLALRPPCFLADEWFCPVGIPTIGIPFYLSHDRLRKLEQKMILDVEGGTKEWFMRLIRHEAGHAYAYAYKLYKRKKWQSIFGLASKPYPDTYRPKPHSRSYVIHLDNWYGQSHPDEDFAETFAVWLTPKNGWRSRYKGWRAMRKLEYVDLLMKSLQNQPPVHQPQFRARDYSGLDLKLKTYYHRKRKLYEESYPDFYDKDLKRIFVENAAENIDQRAASYLRSQRRKILNTVAVWTKEKKYTINGLLNDFIERCDELDLYTRKDDNLLDMNIVAYISSLVMNYLFTGQFKRLK